MTTFRSLTLAALVVALLGISLVVANASPTGIGTPTLRLVPTGTDNVFEIRADGITDGGIGGNGAISWDIYFRYDRQAGMSVASVVPGPAWTSVCTFLASFTEGLPGSGGTGTNGVIINGSCNNAPTGAVTGDNVLVATVTLNNSNVCGGTALLAELDSGDDAFGGPGNEVTDMFDRNSNQRYVFADTSIGAPVAVQICPTAVTVTDLATQSRFPTSVPFALMGAGLVIAAGLAISRFRKR